MFLSGPRLQTHENPGKTSWRKQWRTTHKDLWLSSPTVNLLCRSDTAFIYCLYLFIGQLNMASCALAWSGLTICLRRLGGCCWQFVCGFSMLSRVGGKKLKVNSYDWNIGLLCLFYQIGCVRKKHLVLSVHSYCILIVCFYSTKPVHTSNHESLHVVIIVSLQKLHTKQNNSIIDYLSTG